MRELILFSVNIGFARAIIELFDSNNHRDIWSDSNEIESQVLRTIQSYDVGIRNV